MKRQQRQMLILLVILLACIACYYAAGAYSSYVSEQEELSQAEYEVLSFEAEDLSQLKIEGADGELVLNYNGSEWTFANDIDAEMAAASGDEDESGESSDVGYEVNETTASTILGYLDSLTSEYQITPSEDLSGYGLDDPSMIITLTMTDGTVHTLTFGDYNEMIGEYYYRLDDADVLYTISTYTYNIFNKTDIDLADEVEAEEDSAEEDGEEVDSAEEDGENSTEEDDIGAGDDAADEEDSEAEDTDAGEDSAEEAEGEDAGTGDDSDA